MGIIYDAVNLLTHGKFVAPLKWDGSVFGPSDILVAHDI